MIAWRQLIAIGVARGAIEKRVLCGRLHPLHLGVYAVGHTCVGRSGSLMAAVLSFPDGAVLSHRTAAEVLGLLRPTATRPNVTSSERTLHGRPGIVLHRCRSLAPELATEVDGLPVTTVPRTLLDLASGRDLMPLRRAWEGAQRQGLLDVPAVERLCEHSPGRRTKPLRALIADARDAPDTREEMEHRFADLIREEDLPQPVFNVLIEGYLVDVAWIEQRLVVELDSRAYHSGDAAFETDRIRDVELTLARWRPIRVTWRRLTRQPAQVADQLRRLLSAI